MGFSVLLGLSGGVDSTACAYLLKKNGFSVTGCTLFLNENSNVQSDAYQRALSAARLLDIPLIHTDYRQRFENEVVTYFIHSYLHGITPNPCVKCNPTVKFKSLLQEADKLNIAKIATGHYAKIIQSEEDGKYYIHASLSDKDQSYFLYRLGQDILSRTLFPLGEYLTKDEIRDIAKEAGFSSADAPDSQEICFIPDNDYIGYIYKKAKLKDTPGVFLDNTGKVIGKHNGIIHYTVGQRKGLGAFGEPKYVKHINTANNSITLCNANERFADSLTANNLFWASGKTPDTNKEYSVKIRSTAKPTPAAVEFSEDRMAVRFLSPVLAPSPGQSAVVYDNDRVLGGGIIL